MRPVVIASALLALALSPPAPARQPKDPPLPFLAEKSLTLPRAKDSFRFAVIGDSGTGTDPQYRVAERLVSFYDFFPFELVLMLGDNIYGSKEPGDYVEKFERPYQTLLDSGVKFYAALGNHDDSSQRNYKLFHMGAERYYSFVAPRQSLRFIALDSNYMDPEQLAWLERTLADAHEDWKVCYFHHPLYSSGKRHGPETSLREALEPLFLRHGVNLVLSGHEHFYERLKPQQGIYYFISGSAGKLRPGNIAGTGLTARGFDTGYSFMLFELIGDDLHFQVISDRGETVDQGVLHRQQAASPALAGAGGPPTK